MIDRYMKVAKRAHEAALELGEMALLHFFKGGPQVGWQERSYKALDECLNELYVMNPWGWHYGLYESLVGLLAYYKDEEWKHPGRVAVLCFELARKHG